MDETKKINIANIDPLSYCSLPISLKNIDNGRVLANATGFVYKHINTYFIITNWHNVTGIDPKSRKRLSEYGASPTAIEVPILVHTKPYIKWRRVLLSLYSNEKPRWLIHPEYAEEVDVIALELGEKETLSQIRAINEINFDDQNLLISDDTFIIGFPYKLNSGGNLPLWKRGSVASEPDIDIDDLPKILIDTASRPGMSGSPVIFRRQGIHGLANGEVTNDTIIGEIQNFCGIYSGRISTNTELDSQLGIVWKARVIKEIINGKKTDKKYYPHENSVRQ